MNDRFSESEIVGDSLDNVLVEGLVKQFVGLLSIFAPSDKLGDHRIVVHRDLRALLHSSIESNVLMRFGFLILLEEANGRKEFPGRVLGINSVLNSMTVDLDVVLFELQGVASCDSQLLFYKIDSSDFLSDGMFNL